jgi:hypothetical protein
VLSLTWRDAGGGAPQSTWLHAGMAFAPGRDEDWVSHALGQGAGLLCCFDAPPGTVASQRAAPQRLRDPVALQEPELLEA